MAGVDYNSPDGSQYSRQHIYRPCQLGHPTDNSKTEVTVPQFIPRLVKMSIVDFERILSDIRQFADVAKDLAELQEFCVSRIAESLPHYNWVGFYMLDTNDPDVLVLGPFRGAPTEHVRIPVAQGICGAAVAHGDVIIVDDVESDPRYLACSLETKSEIVVPIRVDGDAIGEIDIDSHSRCAFGGEDRAFLEECAAIVGYFIGQHPG